MADTATFIARTALRGARCETRVTLRRQCVSRWASRSLKASASAPTLKRVRARIPNSLHEQRDNCRRGLWHPDGERSAEAVSATCRNAGNLSHAQGLRAV